MVQGTSKEIKIMGYSTEVLVLEVKKTIIIKRGSTSERYFLTNDGWYGFYLDIDTPDSLGCVEYKERTYKLDEGSIKWLELKKHE